MKRPKSIDWASHHYMGEELRMLRHKRRLTIKGLADLSGFTGAFISKTECALSLPKLHCWLRLAQILCQEQSEYRGLLKTCP